MDSAHKHVVKCPLLKRVGMLDKVHHGGEAWETASRKAKTLKLKDYLATLTEAQKQHALEDVAKELRDLKIDPKDLGKAEEWGRQEPGVAARFAQAFAEAVGGQGAEAMGDDLIDLLDRNPGRRNR